MVPDLMEFTAWWGKQKTWEAITIEGGEWHDRKARSPSSTGLGTPAWGCVGSEWHPH